MKMNLYAVRDRLIDYFMVPFPAPTDNEVKGAIAHQVNNGDTYAIGQAPHQFEIWKLAELDTDEGTIIAKKEYLCDCSSLVRAGVRDDRGPNHQRPQSESTPALGGLRNPPATPPGRSGPFIGVPPPTAPAEHR